MNPLFDLSGRTAIVVGATGMLGGAQAVALAEAGADVVLADVSDRNAGEAIAAVEATGRKARFIRTDITNPASADALVDETEKTFGSVDILVNSAGITHRYPSEEFDLAVFDRILDINLHGLYYASLSASRVMKAQGRGRIVNMASIFGFAGNPESIAYAASKGAVVQLTRTLSVEWAGSGIAVNAIAPSWFETPMGSLVDDLDRIYAGATRKPTKEELHRRTIGRVPLGRMGQPREIAGATVFLASDAASMVTGHVLAVDGGFLAQ